MNCFLNGKRKIFPKNKQFHKLFKLNYIAVYLLCNLSKQKSTETRNSNEKWKKNSCKFKPNANLIDVTREEKKNGKIDLFYCVSEKRKNHNFKWFREKNVFFSFAFYFDQSKRIQKFVRKIIAYYHHNHMHHI